MTLAVTDYERSHYTIEHGHTSIGYYSALATLGFLDRARVIDGVPAQSRHRRSRVLGAGRHRAQFRTPRRDGSRRHRHGARSASQPRRRQPRDLPHAATPAGFRARRSNGFNAAAVHRAPITFVMHRNGIQLSGTTRHIMNQDPRPIISSFGIRILEIRSLHERRALFAAYREAFTSAQDGHPDTDLSDGLGFPGRRPRARLPTSARSTASSMRRVRSPQRTRSRSTRRSGFPDRS